MNRAVRAWLARLPQVLLLVLALTLMARTEKFFAAKTLANILANSSTIGVLAVGQAFALIGGGFDLSQGSMLALTAAATAWLAQGILSPWQAVVAALVIGTLLGTVNGVFVALVRTNPFVTTLSTLLIFRGAAFVLLSGEQISSGMTFAWLSDGVTIGDTVVSHRGLLFLLLAAIAWVVLRQTVFGQYVYAVGGNAEAARLAGVRTARIRIATFALSGLASAVAALALLSWVRVAKSDTAQGYELDAIAACVVGGVSLQGGSGSVLGAMAGALLLQTLTTQITMSGFPDAYRSLVTGLVILTFASADALARRSSRG
jgi:ribose transport system permease protein